MLYFYFRKCYILFYVRWQMNANNCVSVLHKINMERLIQSKAPLYNIFRLSNVVGNGGNKKTIINYLFEKINTKQAFSLWINCYRNIIDVDDAFQIVSQTTVQSTTDGFVAPSPTRKEERENDFTPQS